MKENTSHSKINLLRVKTKPESFLQAHLTLSILKPSKSPSFPAFCSNFYLEVFVSLYILHLPLPKKVIQTTRHHPKKAEISRKKHKEQKSTKPPNYLHNQKNAGNHGFQAHLAIGAAVVGCSTANLRPFSQRCTACVARAARCRGGGRGSSHVHGQRGTSHGYLGWRVGTWTKHWSGFHGVLQP